MKTRHRWTGATRSAAILATPRRALAVRPPWITGPHAVRQWETRRLLLLEAVHIRRRMGLPASRRMPWSGLDEVDLWCNWGPRWRRYKRCVRLVRRLRDIEQRLAPQWACRVADLLPVPEDTQPGSDRLTAVEAVRLASLLPDLVNRGTLAQATWALHWDADLFLNRKE